MPQITKKGRFPATPDFAEKDLADRRDGFGNLEVQRILRMSNDQGLKVQTNPKIQFPRQVPAGFVPWRVGPGSLEVQDAGANHGAHLQMRGARSSIAPALRGRTVAARPFPPSRPTLKDG